MGKNSMPTPWQLNYSATQLPSADLREHEPLLIAPDLVSWVYCYIYLTKENRDKCRPNADKYLIHRKVAAVKLILEKGLKLS